MKKKALCALLTVAMLSSMMVACGEKKDDTTSTPSTGTETGTDAGTDAGSAEVEVVEAGEQGSVLNIYCWNEEFKSRVTDHYPGYTEVDGTHGTIGDVQVVWNITPSDDNAYQNNLDETLLKQESAAADDKIDLFLVEADYALKYVDTDYTMPVKSIGLTDAELADQFKYTQDIVTDSNGVLKGVSWQGCPGVLFYDRAIATEVLGSDDADTVQAAVADWAKFNETAAKVADAGYKMTATVNDTFRVYSNNVTSPWVVDGKLNLDANIKQWVDDGKVLVDAGYTGTDDLWSDAWNAGMMADTAVFCYFGPAWLINFCMHADDAASVAGQGGYGAVVGPQSFFWGGTWICCATGSDNTVLVADIMRQLTTNADIMKDIVTADDDFVNNVPAMDEMANSDYTSSVLGGMNPLGMYAEGAAKIDLSNLSAYDQGCNEEFQGAMKEYFVGNATYDEAIALFKTGVKEKYPELDVDGI